MFFFLAISVFRNWDYMFLFCSVGKGDKIHIIDALEVHEGCHDFMGEIWKDGTVGKSDISVS